MIVTKKNVENVEIINHSIYVIYCNGEIDIYSFDGIFLKNKKNVELLQVDYTGEQCIIEDSYVKLLSCKIKPIRFSLFNNVILSKGRVIVGEIKGRIACYDYFGKLLWEYLSDDISLRVGRVSYLINSNNIVVNIYFIKQNSKKEKLLFLDLESGKTVCEYEISNKDSIFCNIKSVLVDSNLNVVPISVMM